LKTRGLLPAAPGDAKIEKESFFRDAVTFRCFTDMCVTKTILRSYFHADTTFFSR
jgi:hypothetical protein